MMDIRPVAADFQCVLVEDRVPVYSAAKTAANHFTRWLAVRAVVEALKWWPDGR